MLTVIGVIIVLLILIFLIVPLFIRNQYQVEKQVLIQRSNLSVFDFVKLLGNQIYYNKWVMMDPDVKRTSTGVDGTVGFISSWDSQVKNVGKGEQEITKIDPGANIDSTVRFEKPFKNTARVSMTTISVTPGQTRVIWKMVGQNKYPMNLMNLIVPGMLGKDMEESLGNLKNVLER
ncbi:MAG TPA: SRPBCC family protein [Puia sp.]|nr:SRPBCC family protein [Puia sp.]